ncbi:MAG TPA: cytochrome P450 [Solirubrobacterales bacterium]|jgi:cytochrome P450|nr:cytochrome P450 [Solirubrobacterales bacterium]
MASVDTTTPVARPPEMSGNPVRRVVGDLYDEWRGRGKFPPGHTGFSWARTHQIAHDPLPLLLGAYEEFGPIFSLRLLHSRVVFMLGPEANHFVTVGHPENFHWRESSFGDLIPLLGDGLLTIDEDYHDRARAIMMPAFHREQIAASVEAMSIEADRAIEALPIGGVVDIYDWMRNLAMRIAMRALLGLDPDEAGKGAAAAEHFERALGYYGIDFHLRLLRGPGSPWRRLVASRKVLDEIVFGEIERRRAHPDPGRRDILSLLVGARGEGGEEFTDREIRDQVMTLMFAGHDTSTSTLAFMLHELARHPEATRRLREEQERAIGGANPTSEQLEREMPYLEMVLDEVLRLYPPAWIGPRRAVREFEFGGHTVPRGAYVNYCSWASHRLPEVFPEPDAFIPERFSRERKAALPRGAYVPFGGGSRICIGKRFGQTEVKLVATKLLQRLRIDALPGRTMTIRQMPTLSPRGGLRMRVAQRAA